MTNAEQSWSRMDGVDLLRGLAIFFVLMNHVNMQLLFAKVHYLKYLPSQLGASLVWNGQFGVQIFFAVSGFLITSTSLRRWKALWKVSIPDFYKMRFARIAPLMFTLLAVLSVLHFAGAPHYVVSKQTGGLGRALFAALTFHMNWLEATRGYLPGNWDILWSLSVEEMFYLFFPLTCLLLARRKLFIVLLLAFVVAGPFGRTVLTHGNEVWSEYSYLGGMDAIAMGCLTAIFAAWRPLSRGLLWCAGLAGAASLIFILGFSISVAKLGLNRNGLSMSILAAGACLLILVAAQSRWKSPAILAPVLLLGRRSYEVYLTHMFIVLTLSGLFLKIGKPMRLVPVLFFAVIVIAGLLGEMVARFYSEPLNRWLRNRWGDGANRLGSVVEDEASVSV